MDRIGIRELRQHASVFLRRVVAGETIEVTDRGRPVARLVPIPRASNTLERLIAEGRLRPAEGDLLELEPLRPKKGVPLPSEILEEIRRDER